MSTSSPVDWFAVKALSADAELVVVEVTAELALVLEPLLVELPLSLVDVLLDVALLDDVSEDVLVELLDVVSPDDVVVVELVLLSLEPCELAAPDELAAALLLLFELLPEPVSRVETTPIVVLSVEHFINFYEDQIAPQNFTARSEFL